MADQLIIVPHDPEWHVLFHQLGSKLREALGTTALRIDHIGSTAISGLAAKPILDIQISVADFEPLSLGLIMLDSENQRLCARRWRVAIHEVQRAVIRILVCRRAFDRVTCHNAWVSRYTGI